MLETVLNSVCRPGWLLALSAAAVALMLILYRRWTRPHNAAALAAIAAAAAALAMRNDVFRQRAFAPDNIALILLAASVLFFLWMGLRRAAINDENLARGRPLLEEPADRKVLVWPDLVQAELICLLFVTAALVVWSILVPAPLEAPADPAHAPNPAKAPWYFAGLQELLVYFDPWLAGVVYPLLIIIGLCAIPYLDHNPRGNGWYTLRQRPVAISIFLCGFVVLWLAPMFIGVFVRGPNWSAFGPFEPWDIARYDAGATADLSDLWWRHLIGRPRPLDASANPVPFLPCWLVREWPGLLLLGAYLLAGPVVLRRTLLRRIAADMGRGAFAFLSFLLLMMALLPIKMLLRWTLGLKYIAYLPELRASV